jgi:hypothetical protein
MRSKWLDWTPEAGFVGFGGSHPAAFPISQVPGRNGSAAFDPTRPTTIEEVPAREPTKPTEPESPALGNPMLERPPHFWGKHRDAYGWRVHVALEAICQIPAPEGLIVWLGERSPSLYRKLTRDLPNEVSRAWDSQVPHEEFDALCFEWVDTFRRGAELYRLECGTRKAEKSP